MSRIGKSPVKLPSGVTVTVADGVVTVKGPKGQLSQAVDPAITVKQEGDQIILERASESGRHRALVEQTREGSADQDADRRERNSARDDATIGGGTDGWHDARVTCLSRSSPTATRRPRPCGSARPPAG